MILLVALYIYLGVTLIAFLIQRRFMYHPTKSSLSALVPIGQTSGFEPWRNASGQYIGWKRLDKDAGECPKLLIVHGNARSAISRIGYADGFRQLGPWDVYILEYPGYGAREGKPSQEKIFRAAREAFDLLKDDRPLYIMGESLGTGVASYLAGTYPNDVKGMLLVAPYNKLTPVAQVHMPIFPAWLLLWDRFPSATYLKNYSGPIAMIFAGRDLIVPNRFGHRLYDGYHGPKKFWEMPEAGHNDLIKQPVEWWRGVIEFWKSNPAKKEAVVSVAA